MSSPQIGSLQENYDKITMKKLREIFEWFLDKLKILGAVCLVGMTALTCVDVVGVILVTRFLVLLSWSVLWLLFQLLWHCRTHIR